MVVVVVVVVVVEKKGGRNNDRNVLCKGSIFDHVEFCLQHCENNTRFKNAAMQKLSSCQILLEIFILKTTYQLCPFRNLGRGKLTPRKNT
jgi:hypothetical protein